VGNVSVGETKRNHPAVLAAIAAGGALGTLARYGLAQLVPLSAGAFPWATFVTNITGSFALGLVLVVLLRRFPSNRFARPFVATGFLSGYTTYSTFALETVLLARDGNVALAAAYAVASLLAGFAAVYAGIVAGRRLA
jgi:CrcB protein